jgi:hypothetical protein
MHVPCRLRYHPNTQNVLAMLTGPLVDSGGDDENTTQRNQSSGRNRHVSSGHNSSSRSSENGHMEDNRNNVNDTGEGGANGGGGNGPDDGEEDNDEISLQEFKKLVKGKRNLKDNMRCMHFAEMHSKPNMYASFWICVVKHGLRVGIDGVKNEDIVKMAVIWTFWI